MDSTKDQLFVDLPTHLMLEEVMTVLEFFYHSLPVNSRIDFAEHGLVLTPSPWAWEKLTPEQKKYNIDQMHRNINIKYSDAFKMTYIPKEQSNEGL